MSRRSVAMAGSRVVLATASIAAYSAAQSAPNPTMPPSEASTGPSTSAASGATEEAPVGSAATESSSPPNAGGIPSALASDSATEGAPATGAPEPAQAGASLDANHPPAIGPSPAQPGPGLPHAAQGEVVTSQPREESVGSDVLAQGELAALDEDNGSGPIRLYGFADFNYRRAMMEKDSPWYLFVNRHPSMYVGNLNLYIDAEVATDWRLLTEVRYTYLPAGASEVDDETQSQSRVVSNYQDYTDFAGRDRQVGGIMLERAQLEYRLRDELSLMVGQWLSPYGIWVVDHGSPVIIGVFRPFIIGSQLIPERQVGLLAKGRVSLSDDIDLSYALGLSNGRTDYTAFEDMDNNKAITARAALEYFGFGELSLGATVYRGQDTRGTEATYGAATGEGQEPKTRFLVSSRYNEVSYAADLRWVKGPVHFQTEWLMHDTKYTEDGRPMTDGGLFLPNRRLWGGYGLLGYRTPWFGVMPYAKLERSPHPDAQELGYASQYVIATGGINVRAIPQVVFKLEYDYVFFTDEDAKHYSDSTQQYLNAQIACSF